MNDPKSKYWDYKYYWFVHCRKHPHNHVSYGTFTKRINRGWLLKDAIYTPAVHNPTLIERIQISKQRWIRAEDDNRKARMINENIEYIDNFTPKMNYAKTYSQKLPKEKKNWYNFKPKKTRRERIKDRFNNLF